MGKVLKLVPFCLIILRLKLLNSALSSIPFHSIPGVSIHLFSIPPFHSICPFIKFSHSSSSFSYFSKYFRYNSICPLYSALNFPSFKSRAISLLVFDYKKANQYKNHLPYLNSFCRAIKLNRAPSSKIKVFNISQNRIF